MLTWFTPFFIFVVLLLGTLPIVYPCPVFAQLPSTTGRDLYLQSLNPGRSWDLRQAHTCTHNILIRDFNMFSLDTKTSQEFLSALIRIRMICVPELYSSPQIALIHPNFSIHIILLCCEDIWKWVSSSQSISTAVMNPVTIFVFNKPACIASHSFYYCQVS